MVWMTDNTAVYKKGVEEYDKSLVIGEFVNIEAPEYTDSYAALTERVGGS